MAAHFTIAEILAATLGTLFQRGAAVAFPGVSTDSRTTQSGELFIPLAGEHHDGHRFIPKALNRGARGVLVEKRIWAQEGRSTGGTPRQATGGTPMLSTSPEITVIAVDDTLTALGDLARVWRRRFSIPVVALTGSCGKTTTKEMTWGVLSRAFRVLKNEMNLNNLIGLPQTLLGLDNTHEAAVVEMGMNRFGEIRRLTRIAAPTLGVLLNVHAAHTEGVGDIGGVAAAKGELAAALGREALLVYNADDPWITRAARNFTGRTLGFGVREGADLQARERDPQGAQGQTARLYYQGRVWALSLPVSGLHMLYNALAASAVGLALGLKPEATAAALAGFRPVARRSQVVTLDSGVRLLNDCYNANPGSMACALSTLAEIRDSGRAAAALGDMLELGNHAQAAHRELGRQAARAGLDLLVIYGSHREDVAAGAQEGGLGTAKILPVASRAEGAEILRQFLQPGDWLLVKGSRSMHMEGLIEHLENA